MLPRPPRPSQDGAETIAVSALAWLAQDAQRFEPFLTASGIAPEAIRAAAAEPGFLGGVLDFLMAHEPLLLAFCADGGMRPEEVTGAAALLSPAGFRTV